MSAAGWGVKKPARAKRGGPSGTTEAVQARVGFSSQSGSGHEDNPGICLNEGENEMASN